MRLDDASGFNTDAYQADLQAAAAKLCAIFDTTGFAGQFKVYDFGFYLHQENTTGGYPEPFAQKIQEVQALSPYYLLFGKQTDKSGVYTRFWVDLVLPDTFLCAGFNVETTVSDNVKWVIEDQFDKDGRSPNKYSIAETAGMIFLNNKIADLVLCCYQNKNSNSCTNCPDDESIKRLLIEKGFSMSDIDSASIFITITLKNNTELRNERMSQGGLIDGLSEITIWEDGQLWDLNQGLEAELNSYN